ncbi:DUF418 domain-containing protein [Rheinheimera mangrovi]|uniref:DUF418 domain-containing protein n=1 Tax=Rheinheimera mangrovi TaxID=2498451 RepID=UPI000F8C6039|nr:DUF418 domain-containing protein [Rheinheimera mangrovi]
MDALPQVTPRVHQLDALRGVAVLMILFANIFAFGYPLEIAEQAGLSESMSLLSKLQHQLYQLFVRGKFISLLTLLFGASLYLLWQQSQMSENRLKARMSALLLIGFCHAVFVWYGDVLLMYAAVASALLWQRVLHWTPEHQLRYARHYLAAGLVLPALVWLFPAGQVADQADTAKLIALYTGPYHDQLWHQTKYLALVAFDLLFVSYWWFGGIMLLAMWAMQSDWQQLLKTHFVTLLLIALGSGLLPILGTGFNVAGTGLHPLRMISDLCFALIYIRLFLSVIPLFPELLNLLRRCGRCSLSLYLWQSVAMVLLFRWVYPELFGMLGRGSLTTIALIVIMLQLLCVQYFYKTSQLWWFEQLYRWLSLKLERKTQDTAA